MNDYDIIIYIIPPGNDCYIAIEKMAIEIVDSPIDSMVNFHSYVAVYQRVYSLMMVINPMRSPRDAEKSQQGMVRK